MARHLIMGYFYCNAGHKHSSEREMEECNFIEQKKHKDELVIAKENTENQRLENLTEFEKVRLEQQKLELEKIKIDQENKRLQHEETMATLELAKLELAKEKEKTTKSKVCVLS